MSRSYEQISNFENEILELKKQGLSKREINEKLGIITNYIKRCNHKHDKIRLE